MSLNDVLILPDRIYKRLYSGDNPRRNLTHTSGEVGIFRDGAWIVCPGANAATSEPRKTWAPTNCYFSSNALTGPSHTSGLL